MDADVPKVLKGTDICSILAQILYKGVSWNYNPLVFLATETLPGARSGSTASNRSSWSISSRSDSQCSCISCGTSGELKRRPSKVNSAGVKVTDHYRLDEILGEGTFSVVYLAESLAEPGGWAAVKVLEKSSLCKEEDLSFLVAKEVEILSALSHPHIVHLSEVYEDEEAVCLVMELAKGGEVFDRLVQEGHFSEADTAGVIVQLLCAVDHMHKAGVVHRDLKLENLLFYDDEKESRVLVADFGLSDWEWALNEDAPVCGTPGYMAPEVLSGGRVTPSADIWSIGVIAYVLLAGYPPFFPVRSDVDDRSEEEELVDLILKGRYEFHEHTWGDISEDAKDFIRWLMNLDPEARPNCEEALSHHWLNGKIYRRADEGIGETLRSRLAFITGLIALLYCYYHFLTFYFEGKLLSN